MPSKDTWDPVAVENTWSYLTQLAENNEEEYKKFINQTLKEYNPFK